MQRLVVVILLSLTVLNHLVLTRERVKRKREENGEERVHKVGRIPALSPQGIQLSGTKDLCKTSFNNDTLRQRIHEARQMEAVQHGSNAASVRQISSATFFRIAKDVAPKVVCVSPTQSMRRLEALMDSYSPVAHAAVVRSLLGVSPETPQGTIDPSYMYNMDSVSCLIGSEKTQKCTWPHNQSKTSSNYAEAQVKQ